MIIPKYERASCFLRDVLPNHLDLYKKAMVMLHGHVQLDKEQRRPVMALRRPADRRVVIEPQTTQMLSCDSDGPAEGRGRIGTGKRGVQCCLRDRARSARAHRITGHHLKAPWITHRTYPSQPASTSTRTCSGTPSPFTCSAAARMSAMFKPSWDTPHPTRLTSTWAWSRTT